MLHQETSDDNAGMKERLDDEPSESAGATRDRKEWALALDAELHQHFQDQLCNAARHIRIMRHVQTVQRHELYQELTYRSGGKDRPYESLEQYCKLRLGFGSLEYIQRNLPIANLPISLFEKSSLAVEALEVVATLNEPCMRVIAACSKGPIKLSTEDVKLACRYGKRFNKKAKAAQEDAAQEIRRFLQDGGPKPDAPRPQGKPAAAPTPPAPPPSPEKALVEAANRSVGCLQGLGPAVLRLRLAEERGEELALEWVEPLEQFAHDARADVDWLTGYTTRQRARAAAKARGEGGPPVPPDGGGNPGGSPGGGTGGGPGRNRRERERGEGAGEGDGGGRGRNHGTDDKLENGEGTKPETSKPETSKPETSKPETSKVEDVDEDEDEDGDGDGDDDDDSDEEGEDDDDSDDDDSDDDDSDEEGSVIVPPPAIALASKRKPELWKRGERAFAIGYPSFCKPGGTPLSELDRLAVRGIGLCNLGAAATQELVDTYLSPGFLTIDPVLAAHASRGIDDVRGYARLVRAALKPFIATGIAQLTPAFREAARAQALAPPRPRHPAEAQVFTRRFATVDPAVALPSIHDDYDGWELAFPVPTRPVSTETREIPVCEWAVLADHDYLAVTTDDDEAEDEERANNLLAPLAYRSIAASRALVPVLDELLDAIEDEDPADIDLDPRLALQLQASVENFSFQGAGVAHRMTAEAEQGRAIEEERLAAIAAQKAEAESRLIVLGDNERPQRYVIIGIDRKGRLIALSLETPHFIFIIGGTGFGKSYLNEILLEALTMDLPGLSTVCEPQRPVSFLTDYNQGKVRLQFLGNFHPNEDPDQLALLERVYDYRATGTERIPRVTLLTMPDSIPDLKDELAPYLDNGLGLKPIVLGPDDLGMAGYRALLLSGRGANDRDRPAYFDDLEGLISERGEDCLPDDLARAVRNARFPKKVTDALGKRLNFLSGFVQRGARLNDCQSDPHAVYILTQSRTLAPDIVVPFQSVLFSAMCRPQRDGSTPARFLQVDELAKLMGHPIFAGRLREKGQDRRHDRTSFSGVTQFVAGMDPAILTLPTVVVCFRMASVLEVRALKDRFGYLRGIPDEVFLTLQRGECVIAATFTTGETNVYVVRIRPKVTRAGGYTVRLF